MASKVTIYLGRKDDNSMQIKKNTDLNLSKSVFLGVPSLVICIRRNIRRSIRKNTPWSNLWSTPWNTPWNIHLNEQQSHCLELLQERYFVFVPQLVVCCLYHRE